jgi:D-alanyl-D-alanine dipeptidase
MVSPKFNNMSWLKKTVVLVFILAFAIFSNAQLNAIKPNEYGLSVINKKQDYFISIQQEPQKKMVLLNGYLIYAKYDWKYATINNFTQQILYKNPAAYVRIQAAQALQLIEIDLKEQGIGLLIFDAYRPYSVTKKMWEAVPDNRYAANPAKGSNHNRGAAIDVSLYNLQSGDPLQMPTFFDDFSEKAHHNYMQLPQEILTNRSILKNIMTKYGFMALETEWWHYYLPNAASRFELLDFNFRQIRRLTQ